MAEDNPQPQNTGDQQSPGPQPQAGRPPATPQDQNSSGQRRNDRRDRPRYHGGRRDHQRRDLQQSPGTAAPEKPTEPAGKDADIDDEEETEQDRTAPQGRPHHHRGGRPPKKIIEEWANDPYCE